MKVNSILVRLIILFLNGSNSVDTNDIVSVASEQSGTVGRPCQARAGRDLSILSFFRTESVDDDLGFQIPNLDGIISCSTQPVTVRREDKSVDDFTGIQTVQALSFVQVPQHSGMILTTRSGQGTIWRDTDSVQVSGMSEKVVAQLAVGQIPYLNKFIPSTTDDKRYGGTRRETNT